MALTDAQNDSVAYLRELLRSYNLEDLSDWAYEQVVNGNSPAMIRQLLWEQPTFRKRFKVIFDRQAAGLAPMSVDEVIDYERKARQLFQSYGLPPAMYDTPDDFYTFMVNDMALPELNSRLQQHMDYVLNSDPVQRAELKRLYGLTDGQELAYVLDKNRALPIIQSQFQSARNAAAAARSGYGELSLSEAENLTSLGVQGDQAAQGFSALVRSQQLFGALPGFESAENDITREEQLAAAFGSSAADEHKIARRGEARAAISKGGGGFVADREGFRGLGTASS